MSGCWPLVVLAIGGIAEAGPLLVAVTDQGITIAWRGMVRWEWSKGA